MSKKENLTTNKFQLDRVLSYRTFLLLIIIGAMINNLEHSAELYKTISDSVGDKQAYSVVVIFDLIVIALIAVGDSKAILFAISVFAINELAWGGVEVFYTIYRKTIDVSYILDDQTREYLKLITKGATMLIYGSTFAFTVHHFSYLLKKELRKNSKFNSLISWLRKQAVDLSASVADLTARLAESKSEAAELKLIVTDVKQKLSATEQQLTESQQQVENSLAELKKLRKFKEEIEQKLTCSCGVKFDDMGQVFGHQRKCQVHKSNKKSISS